MRSLLDWPRASKAKGAHVAVDWFVGDECGTIGDAVGVVRQLMLLVVLVVINGIIEISGAGGWDQELVRPAWPMGPTRLIGPTWH